MRGRAGHRERAVRLPYASILGGFAAPLFLWLAGIGVALSAGSLSRRGERRAAVVEAIARRGLEIFVLAFLFRLQAFIISPGSYPVTLFRVDILNVMGPAIVASGVVWGLASRRRASDKLVAAYAGLACACAMVTPIVRTSTVVDVLPTWVQWYVRPAGDYTTFTLFPWAGFVFAGAGCGVLLENARDGLAGAPHAAVVRRLRAPRCSLSASPPRHDRPSTRSRRSGPVPRRILRSASAS